jgi:hypothetical protein
MKLQISKEWCMRMAELEGDSEVGAGALAMDPQPRASTLWERIKCNLFHRRHWLAIPYGMHRYECECRACGRYWARTE